MINGIPGTGQVSGAQIWLIIGVASWVKEMQILDFSRPIELLATRDKKEAAFKK